MLGGRIVGHGPLDQRGGSAGAGGRARRRRIGARVHRGRGDADRRSFRDGRRRDAAPGGARCAGDGARRTRTALEPVGGLTLDSRATASLAFVAAALVTVVAVVVAGPPASETLTLAAISVVVDLVAAMAIVRSRRPVVRQAAVAYAFLLMLATGVMFFLAGFLAYGAAAMLLLRQGRRPVGAGSATSPHAFRATSDSWFDADLTPLDLTHGVVGSTQFGQRQCVVCGRGADDPIHAPVVPTA